MEFDYKKYKNYSANSDIYRCYKLKNFSKLNRTKNTNIASNYSNTNNFSYNNKNINTSANISNFDSKNTIVVNDNSNNNSQNACGNILDLSVLDNTNSSNDISLNAKLKDKSGKFIIQNKENNNKTGKKQKSYHKFIKDEDISRILHESYPNCDTNKDYLLNENFAFRNKNHTNCTNENILNYNYKNISNFENVLNKNATDSLNCKNKKLEIVDTSAQQNYANCNTTNNTKNKTINYNINNNKSNNINAEYVDKNFKKNSSKNIKNKTNKSFASKGGVFAGLVVVIVFVVTFLLANYFVPVSYTKLENLTVFAVAKFASSQDDAINIQAFLQDKGAGGVLYNKDNKTYVIADIFLDFDSADYVLKNSSNGSYFDKILEINVKDYCYKNVPNNLNSAVNYALKYIENAFINLQRISFSLAKNDIDVVEAKSRISRLNEEILQTKKIFHSNAKSSSNKNVVNLLSAINVCYAKIEELSSSCNIYSDIREVYITNFINYANIIEDSYTKWFDYIYSLLYNVKEVNMINIGLYGYGNIARGIEEAVKHNSDVNLVAVFTRREPSTVKTNSGVAVYNNSEIANFVGKIDVMILCGGSATDLPIQGPQVLKIFNTIDTFDTHARIPEYYETMDKVGKENGKLGAISVGWDPGLFSLNRCLFDAVLPEGENYTFWGKGVSQGHSDAVRRIEGVLDARQYTIPKEEAVNLVKSGVNPTLSTRDKHLRECFVVAKEGADKAKIEQTIKQMPNYFADYDTIVHFITMDEMKREHSGMPHGGTVIRGGNLSCENKAVISFELNLQSNPQFTSSVVLSYARAVCRMAKEGRTGAVTVLDIPVSYLSKKDNKTLLKELV